MIVLRPARPGDAPALARILTDWQRETAWLPKLHTAEDNQRHIARVIAETEMTVAEDGGHVLGFMSVEGPEIEKLYIAGPARGRGAGGLLVDHAKVRMDRIGLWVFQANSGARRFYARHGFREDRSTDGAENEERLPDIHMIWENAGA